MKLRGSLHGNNVAGKDIWQSILLAASGLVGISGKRYPVTSLAFDVE